MRRQFSKFFSVLCMTPPYINYLLLHNKLVQCLAAENNKHGLPHAFCGSWILETPWLKVSAMKLQLSLHQSCSSTWRLYKVRASDTLFHVAVGSSIHWDARLATS